MLFIVSSWKSWLQSDFQCLTHTHVQINTCTCARWEALSKNCISAFATKWVYFFIFFPAYPVECCWQLWACGSHARKKAHTHKNHSTKAIQAWVTSFVCTSREEGRCTPKGTRRWRGQGDGCCTAFVAITAWVKTDWGHRCLSSGF